MSTQHDDGGPAFPATCQDDRDCAPRYVGGYGGMSLRDWFVGQKPISLSEFAPAYGMPLDEILRDGDHTRTFLALWADANYEAADAMLAARKERAP